MINKYKSIKKQISYYIPQIDNYLKKNEGEING